MGKRFNELTGKDSKLVTGRLDKGDIISEASGSHVGHGEFGSAVSTTKVFAAESVITTFSFLLLVWISTILLKK